MKTDISEAIRLLDRHFPEHRYSLWHLFRDEQRQILDLIIDEALHDIEASFRKIYEAHVAIMEGARQLQVPLPRSFKSVAEFIYNRDIRQLLEAGTYDAEEFERVVTNARRWQVSFDSAALGYLLSRRIAETARDFSGKAEDARQLDHLFYLLKAGQMLQADLNIWRAQNAYFSVGRDVLQKMRARSDAGEEDARQWVEKFVSLSDLLNVKVAE